MPQRNGTTARVQAEKREQIVKDRRPFERRSVLSSVRASAILPLSRLGNFSIEPLMHSLTICFILGLSPSAFAEPVSFRQEVCALLARAGCNQGACHGNLNGKGGFKLSLRGEDPAADRSALTREMLGRRTDPLRPDESLILRKATGQIAHEGGPRFAVGAHRNIASFARGSWPVVATTAPTRRLLTRLSVAPTSAILFDPDDRVKITVKAEFADGSQPRRYPSCRV